MASPVSRKDIFSFYTIDRKLHRRLLFNLKIDPNTSKQIIAFWFSLERIGLRDFIHKTDKVSNAFLFEMAIEAVNCLNYLFAGTELDDLTFTSLFLGVESYSLVIHIQLNVNKSATETNKYVNDLGFRIFHDIDSTAPGRGDKNPSLGFRVERTLFVTFSKGFPITREELLEFFSSRYGLDCVEEIYVHSSGQQDTEENLFARVMVKSCDCLKEILRGREVAQFSVYGKDFRVRQFVPKSNTVWN